MASDSSFDVVSRVEMPEVLNAIDQSMREISQRYDFKGSVSKIELKEKDELINITSDDDFKMKSVVDILQGRFAKRKVPQKAFEYGKVEPGAGGAVKQEVKIKQGIADEKAREVVKFIKGLKMKVQSQIRDKEVRVSGKKKDDLQAVMEKLKENDFGIALQFVNYR